MLSSSCPQNTTIRNYRLRVERLSNNLPKPLLRSLDLSSWGIRQREAWGQKQKISSVQKCTGSACRLVPFVRKCRVHLVLRSPIRAVRSLVPVVVINAKRAWQHVDLVVPKGTSHHPWPMIASGKQGMLP